MYRQKIAQQPKDSELTAGLVRTLLAEQKIDDAESTVKTALAATPQSVELLTALAEVQYREGLPWDEEKTLELAQKVNLCYARLHLVSRSTTCLAPTTPQPLQKSNLRTNLIRMIRTFAGRGYQLCPSQQRIDQLKTYLAPMTPMSTPFAARSTN